ncbi:MAG: TraR/DksA family transcriptional regulator [Saprospiraceae bacterium]
MVNTNRYSDQDLAIFKTCIEQKLEKSKTDLAFLLQQVDDISDAKRNDGDWMDDTSNNNDLELMYTMISRSRRHIQDLENALLRIHHKNYGICSITGALIDKRRLLAVLTTTKSLAAKTAPSENTWRRDRSIRSNANTVTKSKTITTRIIRKNTTPVSTTILQDEDEDLEEDLGFRSENFDTDLFVNEETMEMD